MSNRAAYPEHRRGLSMRPCRCPVTSSIYNVMHAMYFGMLAATAVFDIIFSFLSHNVIWIAGASWLITFGLIIGILPRFIQLFQVFFGYDKGQGAMTLPKLSFWLNVLAAAAAIFNAFVHQRDGYATMPEAWILSVITLLLLIAASVADTLHDRRMEAIAAARGEYQ